MTHQDKKGPVSALIWFFLDNPLITFLLLFGVITLGVYVLPFQLPPQIEKHMDRAPVPVDAIPDIGENQQIVFTDWSGRSPQDVEDQISYPLAVSLQGIPGVKSIRSYSMFGFSSIYIIFEDSIEFYWSRSRVLERLAVASKDLPEGVTPVLGPDATALGQIYWYTLEGEGFSLEELRTVQDWYVRYALQSAVGVSEVASIGGYVREYQIDVDPAAMWEYKIALSQVFKAVKMANLDIGAKTIEHNGVEYVVRGIGFIKSVKDVENIVVKEVDNTPIYLKQIGHISLGPAIRRGVLDKEGAEVVGGVVVARYGDNPLKVIKNVQKKIAEISPGLASKVLPNGKISRVKIVPFYDRTELIYETLDTLKDALIDETLITIVVILLFMMHFRSSMVVSLSLPLGVLIAFVFMKLYKVDSNIMSLSGIAIAIGAMVDMGIIMTENIVRHLDEAPPEKSQIAVVYEAASEVGGAILTAICTTIISFLPIFFLEGPEGKLFRPLAFTKTFALFGSVLVALLFNPLFCYYLFGKRKEKFAWMKHIKLGGFAILSLIGFKINPWLGVILLLYTVYKFFEEKLAEKLGKKGGYSLCIVLIILVTYWLGARVMPLGRNIALAQNIIVMAILIGVMISFLLFFIHFYEKTLVFLLNHKKVFMTIPFILIFMGIVIWQGFNKVCTSLVRTTKTSWLREQYVASLPTKSIKNLNKEKLTKNIKEAFAKSQFFLKKPRLTLHKKNKKWTIKDGANSYLLLASNQDVKAYKIRDSWQWLSKTFPGLGEEFMPELDEGSYLSMPTTMPHASLGEVQDVMRKQDIALKKIPEIEMVVGKLGRVESPLDPAPISMLETFIVYKKEYIQKDGKWIRQWRDHIKTRHDIWDEIVKAVEMPGVTTPPELQPIATRIVMLQTGMRAPMGVKVKGKDLAELEKVGFQIETFLKQVPSVKASTVNADRIIGKPYLEFVIDREKIARYGVNILDVQHVISVAIGGMKITTTVEGRERYTVRVRYKRELRDSLEAMPKILVPTRRGTQIPLSQVATMTYTRGPQVIKSEDTFLIGYITFDRKKKYSEVAVVEQAKKYLQKKIDSGDFKLPAGTSYKFSGTYENQVRAAKRLKILVPTSLLIIFLLIYLEFRSVILTLIVFIALPVALSGGFILLWLYGQSWFMNIHVFGFSIRTMFHMGQYNLSVAVWVGFIALFGVATDDGVVMGSYLTQSFAKSKPKTKEEIRKATIFAGCRRIRPCLMTVATTVLALIPVLLSTGKGSDVMIPMALPTVGGLSVVLITLFVVPVCYCGYQEFMLNAGLLNNDDPNNDPSDNPSDNNNDDDIKS